jgi:hypothetical protein
LIFGLIVNTDDFAKIPSVPRFAGLRFIPRHFDVHISTPHSSGIARLASGAFCCVVNSLTFCEIINTDNTRFPMTALLEQRILSNGLRLEIRDESRKVAGDRWRVSLRALVSVPLPADPPEGISRETLELLRREVGETVFFHQVETRNFIAEKDTSRVLENLKKTFLENSLAYLSHPCFAGRFLKSTAVKIQEQGRYGPEYLQKTLMTLKPPGEDS